MHVRGLVELGALVAARGALFMRPTDDLVERHVQHYWSASRCRFDRWGLEIRECSKLTQRSSCDQAWDDVRPTLEEILVSELLTRIWTAVACAHDRSQGCGQLEPILRSVMANHLEARNRALSLLVFARGLDVEQAVELNRLRRRAERWTDMLLAHLLPHLDIDEFAYSPSRSHEFAADLANEKVHSPGVRTWEVIVASLRAAFQLGISDCSLNTDLNQEIAASVLACFHSDLFDSSPLAQPMWLMRMARIADDAQELIDNLLEQECHPHTRSAP